MNQFKCFLGLVIYSQGSKNWFKILRLRTTLAAVTVRLWSLRSWEKLATHKSEFQPWTWKSRCSPLHGPAWQDSPEILAGVQRAQESCNRLLWGGFSDSLLRGKEWSILTHRKWSNHSRRPVRMNRKILCDFRYKKEINRRWKQSAQKE